MTPRRVLVTGGASGIGRATVTALLDAGARVAVVDSSIDSSIADRTRAVTWIGADVADEADVQRAFARVAAEFGRLDVVIHCAGIMREQGRDLREITLESWREVITVNLTGAFLVAREAARLMAPGGGVLILVGSGAGTTGPSGSVPYGASKGGVNGLALTLAKQLRPLGIRVHNVLPGVVDTPLLRRSLDEGLDNGAPRAAIDTTRGQLVDAAGVGRVLAFLASADADAVDGVVSTR